MAEELGVGPGPELRALHQRILAGDPALTAPPRPRRRPWVVPDGPEMSLPVAARLLGQPEDAAERVLERLVDTQLLETPVPGRYRLHDLLRLYARELAHRHHPEPARAAALTRALRFYVASAWQTLAVLRPGDYRLTRADRDWRDGGLQLAGQQAALAWLETERANLLAAVRQAVATPGVPTDAGIQLAHALFGFFWVHSHHTDWVQANQIALEAARQGGDLAALEWLHTGDADQVRALLGLCPALRPVLPLRSLCAAAAPNAVLGAGRGRAAGGPRSTSSMLTAAGGLAFGAVMVVAASGRQPGKAR